MCLPWCRPRQYDYGRNRKDSGAHGRPGSENQLDHDGAGHKAPPTPPHLQPPAAGGGHGYSQDKVDEETTLKQQQLQLPASHNNKASGAAPDDHREKNPMDFNHH